jgi:hypothetical protein
MIKGLERLQHTTLHLGGHGDNWHMTWADDDKQYVSLCDGNGLPGTPDDRYHNSRAYTISGDPPAVTFEYLPGYPDLIGVDEPLGSNRYYNFGILARDGKLYQYLSTPNHQFREPDARFVGAKLITSPDNGSTWCNQNGSSPVVWEPWDERSKNNMLFFEEAGDAFSLLTVLQMGQGYRDNTDGFVYLYAPNGNVEGTMNQLVMCRVPADRILSRDAYEFFVALRPDGSAEWTTRIEDRGVVYTFPSGWVNTTVHPYAWHPSVVYYAPLGVYLMANWGMGCTAEGKWFGKPSYLGFWTAPSPWGPWTQVHEEREWQPEGEAKARAYQPQIGPKWISGDGSSFWLVWTDFQVLKGMMPYYAFNMQEVRVHAG